MLPTVIIGAGNAGQRHLGAFQAAGVPAQAIDVSDNWKMAVERSDIVSIATPDNLHPEMALYALAKGKHVFCEKPLSHKRADLDNLWDIHRQAPGTFSCNLPLRHVPEFAEMLSVTRAEARGPLYLIEGMYAWGRWPKMQGWRGQIDGYSIVCGGGIHILDLMIQATGRQPTDIQAYRSDRRAVVAVFRMGDAVGRLTVNFGYEGGHRTGLSLFGHDGFDSNLHDDATDFGPGIRQFLADIQASRKGNGMEALQANRAALAIEEACR